MRKKKKALIAGLAIFAGASATVSALTMGNIFAANDTCTVINSADWGADVNSLNGLYAAFGAGSCVDKDANTNTITLKKDIVAEKRILFNWRTDAAQEYKINLNGHNITTKNTENGALFTVCNKAKLIIDGQGNVVDENDGGIFLVIGSAELVVNDGTYTTSGRLLNVNVREKPEEKGKIKITGGKFNTKYASLTANADVTITGGVFNSGTNVLRVGNDFPYIDASLMQNRKYSTSTIISGNPIFRAGVDFDGNIINGGELSGDIG